MAFGSGGDGSWYLKACRPRSNDTMTHCYPSARRRKTRERLAGCIEQVSWESCWGEIELGLLVNGTQVNGPLCAIGQSQQPF